MRRSLILAWKTVTEMGRDRVLLRMTLIVPVVMILILGSAISRDVRHVAMVICDEDNSPVSRLLIDKLEATKTFDVIASEPDEGRIESWLVSGKATAALVVPADLSARLLGGRTATVQVLLSGEDPTVASIGSAFLEGLLREMPMMASVPSAPDPRIRVLFNPDLESKDYMVPIIAVILLMLVTMMLTSMSIVRERETGTLEQLLVTPFRAHEIVLGKTVPHIVIGLIVFFSALLVARPIYNFPMHGNMLLLLGLAALFTLSMLGAGILVSTIARTQQQALFTTWFIAIFFLLMSGFIFPIENMPSFMQYLTYLDPLRYFVTIVRGVLMKSAGFDVLWPQGLALAIYGVVTLVVSALRFRRTIGA